MKVTKNKKSITSYAITALIVIAVILEFAGKFTIVKAIIGVVLLFLSIYSLKLNSD